MISNRKASQKGFTLIEILVVIGLIAILAAIVLIAINPARQFAQGRDSQRVSNLNAILNAVGQRMADNKGTFEGTFTIAGTTYTCPILPSSATSSVNKTMAASVSEVSGNLNCLVPTYIPTLPLDPIAGSGNITGYAIIKDGQGRVTVSAPSTEPSIPRDTALEIVR